MKPIFRNPLTAAAFAIAAGSTTAKMALWSYYLSNRPTEPDVALGLVYPLVNHGSVAYINAVESTGLGLLGSIALFAFVAMIAFASRDRITSNDGSDESEQDPWPPQTQNYGQVSWGVMACSLGVFLCIVYFRGESIAAFLVSQGFVLD